MTEQLDLVAIRHNAADGLPMLPSTVLALCDQLAGMEDALSLRLRQIAEQQDYINGLHACLLTWATAVQYGDLTAVAEAQGEVLRWVGA